MSLLEKINQSINVEWLVKNNNRILSSRSRQRGYNFYCERYIHGVSLSEKDNTVSIQAKCFRSMRKNELPHKVRVDVQEDVVADSMCSCTAG